MNERIRRLADEAGFRSNPDMYDRNQSFDIDKFTQLIVQECIDIIAPYSVRMIRPGELYLNPIQEIKQHFRS